MMGLRAAPALRLAVEDWAKEQPDEPCLSDAIRRLVELGLAGAQPMKRRSPNAEAKASDMAGERIDKLANPAIPEEERRARKRRLIKGSREFRGSTLFAAALDRQSRQSVSSFRIGANAGAAAGEVGGDGDGAGRAEARYGDVANTMAQTAARQGTAHGRGTAEIMRRSGKAKPVV